MIIHGNEGYASVGAAELKLTSWTLSRSAPGTQASDMGDPFQTVLGGAPKAYSGTLVFNKKSADAVQASVAEGITLTLSLYAQGNSSGKTYLTGQAYIETVDETQGPDGPVPVTATWQSTGPWSEETVV